MQSGSSRPVVRHPFLRRSGNTEGKQLATVSHTSLLRQLSYRCIELSVRVSPPTAGNEAVYFGVHLGRQRLGKASRRGCS